VNWKAAVGWVLGAAAIGGFVLLYERCDAERVGDPTSATLLDGKDGPEVLLVNLLSNDEDPDTTQATVLDARTGAVIGGRRLDRGGAESCWNATPGRVWCDFGRLAVHDARTLDTVLAFDDAIAKGQLGHSMDSYSTSGAGAWMQLDDGRVAHLDASTLAVDVVDRAPDGASNNHGASESVETSSSIDIGGAHWTIDGGPRVAIVKGGPQFLQPRFVLANNEPLVVERDPLILYSTSLDSQRDRAQLARIGSNGAAVWSVDLGGNVEMIAHAGDDLIIATGATDHRALAIDSRTGATRWTYSQ
jgi:hypothetical protein